jgi:hypothetical protein
MTQHDDPHDWEESWGGPLNVGFFDVSGPQYVSSYQTKKDYYSKLLATPIITKEVADELTATLPGRLVPEPPPELTSQMFEDALEHLLKHGWTQGADIDRDSGRVCTQGAFGLWDMRRSTLTAGASEVFHNQERFSTFHKRQAEIMELMGIAPHFGSVVAWNDWYDRTEQDVIDALTLGAKKLRELGR